MTGDRTVQPLPDSAEQASDEPFVVRIVQRRAPSELCYLVPRSECDTFMVRWRYQNPGQWLQGSSMPLIVDLGDDHLIPVEYPAAAGGTS